MRTLLIASVAGCVAASCMDDGVAAEKTRWKENVLTDRLTGQKTIQATNNALGLIKQFGRVVNASLVISCVHPREKGEDHREDYLSGFMRFSEPVGLTDTRVRYRLDAGKVHDAPFGVSARGDYFQFVGGNELLEELEGASKLRAEVDLPWAGNVLLEFNTAGAKEAMGHIPCGT